MTMAYQIIVDAEVLDENIKISIVDVCETCNISEDTLLEMMEYGLFHHQNMHLKMIHVDHKSFDRIRSACRLQHDLDINLPGVVLILELLDELDQARQELSILQHHVK